jgi:hydrogenase maturation protease
MPSTIAIFGLGNPLMADEGVGIRVLEALQRRDDLPAYVELIDLGTGGWRLLDETAGRRALIFVDCALMGEQPGTIRRFRPEQVRSSRVRMRGGLHDGDLLSSLALAAALGKCSGDVVIFGIEPERIGPGLELTAALSSRLEEYAARILEEARGS